jgi:hypothetical protein
MSDPSSTLPRWGRKFLWTSALLLTAIFAALGLHTVGTVRQLRAEALERHVARMDPKGVEKGRTAAEDELPPGAKPRQVKVGIYLDGIASISLLDSEWSPVFYIWFRWQGDDIDPGESFNIVEGEIENKTLLSKKVENGERYALYLVQAKVTKFFNTSRFPVDDHLLTLAIEDGSLTWEQLEYVADAEGSNISSRVKMPGYKVLKSAMVVKPHAYKSSFGDPSLPPSTRRTYSQLIYGIWNGRTGYGPYLKVFVGLFAAAAIALLPFFIKPTQVDPRFGLGVGGFFGAVANTLLSASLVPDSGILTLMDMVNGVGAITIFLTLVQSTISLHLYDTLGEEALSRAFDRLSFVVFAAGFAVINLLIPLAGFAR